MKIGNSLRSRAGFTLIELLVVFFIIGIVGGALFNNYRQGASGALLRVAAQDLSSGIRRAQSAALSGQLYQGSYMRDYRVFITNSGTSFKICATSFSDVNINYCPNKIIESVELPRGVKVSDLNLGSIGTVSKADIVFPVPYANPSFVYGASALTDSTNILTIYLQNASGNTDSVFIQPISGRIEVED